MSMFDKLAEMHDKINKNAHAVEKKAFLGKMITAPVKALFKPAKAVAKTVAKHPMKSLGVAGTAATVGMAGADASRRNSTMKQMTSRGAPPKAISNIN